MNVVIKDFYRYLVFDGLLCLGVTAVLLSFSHTWGSVAAMLFVLYEFYTCIWKNTMFRCFAPYVRAFGVVKLLKSETFVEQCFNSEQSVIKNCWFSKHFMYINETVVPIQLVDSYFNDRQGKLYFGLTNGGDVKIGKLASDDASVKQLVKFIANNYGIKLKNQHLIKAELRNKIDQFLLKVHNKETFINYIMKK